MQFAKSVIRRSLPYRAFQRIRTRRALERWSAHDQLMADFYAQFVAAGSLCFDVGSNIGNRVKVFLKLGARVIGVEPQNDCIEMLNSTFGGNDRFTLVPCVLGDCEKQADLWIGSSNTISSLSSQWIEAVQRTRRFDGAEWTKKQSVTMTTLDNLIERYGMPSFIKIDVEGFEYEVLQGLTRPVRALSLEFTPEMIDSTFKCIDHLGQLGDIQLNYCLGETMQFVSDEWLSPQGMIDVLTGLRTNYSLFGDLYVKSAS